MRKKYASGKISAIACLEKTINSVLTPFRPFDPLLFSAGFDGGNAASRAGVAGIFCCWGASGAELEM